MIYGIDIGGTKIAISVFDNELIEQDSWRVKTPAQDYHELLKSISNMIETADKRYNEPGIVGLGMAGIRDTNNLSITSNIPAVNGKDIAADLGKSVNRKVTIENDCRCFALSEATGGAAKSYSSMYGAIIGTGAAGGFVLNGKLLEDTQGIAGEYGHIQLPAFLQQKYDLELRTCGCGLPSCYEGYISGPGLIFLHNHFDGQHKEVPELVKAWRKNDKIAMKTMSCFFDILGACFANLILTYDPKVIVLGGGISLIDEVTGQLPNNIEKHLFKGVSSPPVIKAKFGDASGARGAAILAMRQNLNL